METKVEITEEEIEQAIAEIIEYTDTHLAPR